MNKIFFSLATAMFTASLCWLTSCSDESGGEIENVPRMPIGLDAAQTRACNAGNEFGIRLIQQVNGFEAEQNFVISPITVSMNLAMLANGADGETVDHLLTFLGSSAIEELNSYYRLMLETLPGMDRLVSMRFANSVWLEDSLAISPDFSKVAQDTFRASCFAFDGNKGDTWTEINRWCEESTDGQIKGFLDTPPAGNAFLISATCFNAQWELFDEDNTRESVFHNASGSTSNVMMMHTGKSRGLRCQSHDEWSSVCMEYGNGSFNLSVILPAEGKSVNEVLAMLSAEDLQSSSYDYDLIDVKLPRFSLDTKLYLGRALAALGFDIKYKGNTFDGISVPGPKFDQLIHQTVITTNERGTQAASIAFTGKDGAPLSSEFIVDRPFIFFITETSTDAILYAGIVREL